MLKPNPVQGKCSSCCCCRCIWLYLSAHYFSTGSFNRQTKTHKINILKINLMHKYVHQHRILLVTCIIYYKFLVHSEIWCLWSTDFLLGYFISFHFLSTHTTPERHGRLEFRVSLKGTGTLQKCHHMGNIF